jgi:hypothetical protein
LNIRNANIHKAADFIRVGEGAQRYRRLIRGGAAADVHNEPRIRDLDMPRGTLYYLAPMQKDPQFKGFMISASYWCLESTAAINGEL